jgi:hypothetical protein
VQPEPATQQSPSEVHAAPSATHDEAHSSALAAGRQWPPQHVVGTLHGVSSRAHAASPGGPAQRWTVAGGGEGVHVDPAQQSGFPPQASPVAPQVGDGRHTPAPSPWALQVPEQQSSAVLHVSHSNRQPPPLAQRFVPSLRWTQLREQQSSFPPQISPTSRVQFLWSLPMQPGRGTQCPTDCGSS